MDDYYHLMVSNTGISLLVQKCGVRLKIIIIIVLKYTHQNTAVSERLPTLPYYFATTEV